MWIKGKHMAVDNQGRRVKRDITINLNQALAYIELDEERTRVLFEVGHDIEDHRNSNWIDLQEPKTRIDSLLGHNKTH